MVLEKYTQTLQRRLSGCVSEFRKDESGATAIEYGLIVALIFIAIVASVRSFTDSASEMYGTIDETIDSAIQ